MLFDNYIFQIRYLKSEWYMGMKIDEGPYKNAGPYASDSEAILTY